MSLPKMERSSKFCSYVQPLACPHAPGNSACWCFALAALRPRVKLVLAMWQECAQWGEPGSSTSGDVLACRWKEGRKEGQGSTPTPNFPAWFPCTFLLKCGVAGKRGLLHPKADKPRVAPHSWTFFHAEERWAAMAASLLLLLMGMGRLLANLPHAFAWEIWPAPHTLLWRLQFQLCFLFLLPTCGIRCSPQLLGSFYALEAWHIFSGPFKFQRIPFMLALANKGCILLAETVKPAPCCNWECSKSPPQPSSNSILTLLTSSAIETKLYEAISFFLC